MGTITERIDAITSLPEEYRNTIIPVPKSVKIELTGKCNFSCTFCARSKQLRNQDHMDKALFKRLAMELRAAGVEELGLFYLGESFLVPWLAEAVSFAKNAVGFPYVFLTTNGMTAAPSKVKQVMAAGLDSLKFSFNYADAAQFCDITQTPEAGFKVMIDNIREAYRIREDNSFECGLYASYIEYTGDQGKKMENAVGLIRPYVDEVYALPLYNQGSLVAEDALDKGWTPSAGNRGRVGALREPLPCWAVFTEGHITWDGKLSACCFDHNDTFTMADLTKTPFMEGWNSEKFQALRLSHLKKDIIGTPCEKCLVG